MTSSFRSRSISVLVGFLLLPVAVAIAGDAKTVPAAPLPKQIVMAKKVFIANGGLDDPGIEEALFKGGKDRAYDQFYAALKSAGTYDLVDSPADADLIFEISFVVLPEPARVFQGSSVGAPADPVFRLEIRDPKMNAMLWAYIEHAQWAILQGNRDRNFDQGMARIVSDVAALARSAAPIRCCDCWPMARTPACGTHRAGRR